MLAPHSAPPHLSWRSGVFKLPEKHSAYVCIWLAICLHSVCIVRISFQFQYFEPKPSLTLWPRSCHHPLLAAPRSACGVPRGVAFTPSQLCSFRAETFCFHRTEADTSDWLASEPTASHNQRSTECVQYLLNLLLILKFGKRIFLKVSFLVTLQIFLFFHPINPTD